MKIDRRALKFWFLRTVVVWPGILLLKLLNATYRVSEKEWREFQEAVSHHPRVIVASWHGNLLALMALTKVSKSLKREICVLISPSRDGKLAADVAHSMGLKTITGSTKRRAVAGARNVVAEVENGNLAFLAIDGPRGPAMVPKPGIVRIAPLSGATLITLSLGARKAIHFGSWDGMYLPLPFSKIHLRSREFDFVPSRGEGLEDTLRQLEKTMREDACAVNCPVVEKDQ